MAHTASRKRDAQSRIAAVAALVLVVMLPACEDAIGLDEHFDVAEVMLTVGDASVRITGGGGSLRIDEGTHDVTAFARDAEGDEIRATIEISSSNQSVARYSGLTGTLVAAPGTAQLSVSVMHGAHADFQETVTLTVQ